MTLILKELIVRGIVTDDHSFLNESSMDHEELLRYLEQMRKEIEKECVEKVLQKIGTKTVR